MGFGTAEITSKGWIRKGHTRPKGPFCDNRILRRY